MIIVYTQAKEVILQIDKLRLAVGNDILKMCFSPNSENLLIWRNNSVQVFNVVRGMKIIDLTMSWRPALDVKVDGKSENIK